MDAAHYWTPEGIGRLVGRVLFAVNANLGASWIITLYHFIYAGTDAWIWMWSMLTSKGPENEMLRGRTDIAGDAFCSWEIHSVGKLLLLLLWLLSSQIRAIIKRKYIFFFRTGCYFFQTQSSRAQPILKKPSLSLMLPPWPCAHVNSLQPKVFPAHPPPCPLWSLGAVAAAATVWW